MFPANLINGNLRADGEYRANVAVVSTDLSQHVRPDVTSPWNVNRFAKH